MAVTTLDLVCFSPTRTTRRTLEAVAQGLGAAKINAVDLTPPAFETVEPPVLKGRVALLGSPVYSGRIPALAARRLRRLKGRGAPALAVVCYGNRAYEDALLELVDIAVEIGFRPVAAGAFIGEHSFSTPEAPTAVGRPDSGDLGAARDFGAAVAARIEAAEYPDGLPLVQVPGNRPYKAPRTDLRAFPSWDAEKCSLCGECVELCPTGCISMDGDQVATRGEDCVRCCACIKGCPEQARRMDDPEMVMIAKWLADNCSEPAPPRIFL